MSVIPEPPRTEETQEVSRWSWHLTKALRDRQIADAKEIQTLDATPTILFKRTIEDKSAYWIEGYILAQKSDATDRAAYLRRVLVFRNGGAATIQGAVSAVETIESDVTWDATFDVLGNDVRLKVTGKAGTTINWNAVILYIHRMR